MIIELFEMHVGRYRLALRVGARFERSELNVLARRLVPQARRRRLDAAQARSSLDTSVFAIWRLQTNALFSLSMIWSQFVSWAYTCEAWVRTVCSSGDGWLDRVALTWYVGSNTLVVT
jgi:hypothetical protein